MNIGTMTDGNTRKKSVREEGAGDALLLFDDKGCLWLGARVTMNQPDGGVHVGSKSNATAPLR
jgi:hypothetical protein